ncbi:ferric-dicitrate binding protein FerR (iron transport regulator) [Chitinophaga terrae (ex Kim and Jung 2007)]|uniref:FecR family protein n=1 Tax=Chitinophaga terrae (ex Kim and Jung 2007) TaxID=408074 RepID=UPI002783917B|nr:FecR family protein [Chitinophaga terrae (ex Kim and Jung 2007)]MDQ0108475.1 ferric-dicitrate binding protein FerR (iron transport regulator) [Chitinophaga terrae (ex Kim and Jung 2007)]
MTISRFRYLFKRYYSQSCTWEERQEFLLLLNQSEHDEELNALLEELLSEEERTERMPDEPAMRILETIMSTTVPAKRSYRSTIVKSAWWIGSAASVLLIAWWVTKQRPPAFKPVASIQVKDSSSNARLIIGSGEVIDLGKKTDDSITVQQGLAVSKTGNQLAYDQSANATPTINTLITDKGGTYKLVLPDGSKVWLNATSSLRFPTSFSGDYREVMVNGEAYFEIAANAKQPFIVTTPKSKVVVLGTQFNIKAYQEEEQEYTTLLQGAVNVDNGHNIKRLQPGEQAAISDGDQIRIRKPDIETTTAWKEGKFRFNDNIQVIMRELARWYDFKVVYVGTVTSRSYEASFSRKDSLEEILHQLEMTGDIHFSITDKTITVSP